MKNKIIWCDRTWNPITGCKRRCFYCYARPYHNRFFRSMYGEFTNIIFHTDRLNKPLHWKKPQHQKIFIGSMSDYRYWSIPQIKAVLSVVAECDQHDFYILTKDICEYYKFNDYKNLYSGITFDLQFTIPTIRYDKILNNVIDNSVHPFINFEPLLGIVPKSNLYNRFEFIIVGEMTGTLRNKYFPNDDIIKSIKYEFPQEKLIYKTKWIKDKCMEGDNGKQ